MQEAVIRRVDPGLGVLLELRLDQEAEAAAATGKLTGGAEPPVAGYAHISAVSDKRVEKLEKVTFVPVHHLTFPEQCWDL